MEKVNMKKNLIVLLILGICGLGGIFALNIYQNKLEVHLEEYFERTYGMEWAENLVLEYGEEIDDFLEADIELKFGKNYEDEIEDLIKSKLSINDIEQLKSKRDINNDNNNARSENAHFGKSKEEIENSYREVIVGN